MGSRLEEVALAKHMPESFKEACPICKTPWTVNMVEGKMQFECRSCGHDQVVKAQPMKWWATSGSYVHASDWAWQKLWREFVLRFGLTKAVSLCSE
jgi:predicted RNA-binding Zn-ribbon protein involved in translation (DUF1610 family)